MIPAFAEPVAVRLLMKKLATAGIFGGVVTTFW